MKRRIIAAVSALLCLSALSGCSDVNSIDNSSTIQSDTTASDSVLSESSSEISTDITDSVFSEPDETSETATPAQSIILSQDAVTVIINQSTSVGMTVTPPEAVSSLVWSSTDSSIAAVDNDGNIRGISEGACTVIVKDSCNPEMSASLYVTVKSKAETEIISHSTNGVYQLTYVKGILVANKSYPLPTDYDPGVNEDAKKAFDEMQKAAFAEGLNLYISSGYRSYSTEKTLYDSYVLKDGQQVADTYAERPGYSEHQTGLAFDLNTMDAAFGETDEGKWLAENCWKYGFIIRYPKGKEAITGYAYQPWHIRYLGPNVASSVYQSQLCLEEFLEITSQYENEPAAAPINPAAQTAPANPAVTTATNTQQIAEVTTAESAAASDDSSAAN
ncbi:MAG: D-alanyl-D-alanine carboxypeptidase family protein [Oscillospiraceae bacterium]